MVVLEIDGGGIWLWWSSWGLAFTMKVGMVGLLEGLAVKGGGGPKRICIKSHRRIHVCLSQDGVNLQCDADNIQLFLAEVKLAWIVRIVAAILKTLQISGQWRIARSI
nr:hypothetical protein CFP56_25182 [Quercus suber]